MTKEEKAKAYDEAIEKAKKYKTWHNDGLKKCIDDMFPQLAESEDERIRKSLIELVQQYGDAFYSQVSKGAAINWLEKQSEQKSIIIPKFREGDLIRYKSNPDDIERVDAIIDDYYILDIKGECNHVLFTCQDLWELVEQKPVEYNEYSGRDKELSLSLQIQAYLNTASDELYAKGKSLYSEKRIEDIHKCMEMWLKLHNSYFYNGQKPVEWSEEDESFRKDAIKCIGRLYVDYTHNKEFYKTLTHNTVEIEAWLKSLKDRSLPQPKQEWSANDEFAIKILNTVCDEYQKISTYKGTEFRHEIIDAKNWLKSLRPQKQWKPSEEQIISEFKVGDILRRKSDGCEAKVTRVINGNVEVECADWTQFILNKEWELIQRNYWKPSEVQMKALRTVIENTNASVLNSNLLQTLVILENNLKAL